MLYSQNWQDSKTYKQVQMATYITKTNLEKRKQSWRIHVTIHLHLGVCIIMAVWQKPTQHCKN